MILSILPLSPPSSSSSNSSPPQTGRILIVVWSSEQDPSLLGARSARRTTGGKKGAIEIELNEGEGEEGLRGKDVFVPWEKQGEVVPRKKKEPTPRRRKPTPSSETKVEEGRSEKEKEETIPPTNQISNLNLSSSSFTSSPTPTPSPTIIDSKTEGEPSKPTFNRYYHLFTQYELSSLVRSAALDLKLSFECPEDYPLDPSISLSREDEEEKGGWKGVVRLKEERWERENWVVEIEVGWRKE